MTKRFSIAVGVLALASFAAMWPLLVSPPPTHVDWSLTRVWAEQYAEQMRARHLLPRWLPDAFGGLGAPSFYFYPPLAYTLSSLPQFVGFDALHSVYLAYFAAFLVGGIGTWRLLEGRSRSPLIGALFFTLAPYHLLDFAWRGAFAESVGIALLPWLALGLVRVRESGRWAGAALAYGLLICTHLPLALLASLFLILPYALFHRSRLLDVARATVLGICVSLFSLLPALWLAPFRDGSHLARNPMLRAEHWNFLTISPSESVMPALLAALGALSVAAVLMLGTSARRLALYALAVLILGSGILTVVWALPLLREVQFPARILPLAELALAVAIARIGLRGGWPARIAFAVPLLTSVLFASPPRHLALDPAVSIAGNPDGAQHTPPGAYRGDHPVPSLNEIRAGRIPPPTEPGWIVEPTFYFPAWSCGEMDPATKLLRHRADCTPTLRTLPVEWWSGLASLLAALAIGLAAVSGRRRTI